MIRDYRKQRKLGHIAFCVQKMFPYKQSCEMANNGRTLYEKSKCRESQANSEKRFLVYGGNIIM